MPQLSRSSLLGGLVSILLFSLGEALSPAWGPFSVPRIGRSCAVEVKPDVYRPGSQVDAFDLTLFNTLQQMTTHDDPFEATNGQFFKLSNEFRQRTPCALPTLPVGTYISGKEVRQILEKCQCDKVRQQLMSGVLGAYRCDISYSDRDDLMKQIHAKIDRFNRFLRFQIAIGGGMFAVEQYDEMVTKCVHNYLEEGMQSYGGSNDHPQDTATSNPLDEASPSAIGVGQCKCTCNEAGWSSTSPHVEVKI